MKVIREYEVKISDQDEKAIWDIDGDGTALKEFWWVATEYCNMGNSKTLYYVQNTNPEHDGADTRAWGDANDVSVDPDEPETKEYKILFVLKDWTADETGFRFAE